MVRPSKNIDKILIDVAKVMIARDGFDAFSVRALCLEAKVNLGMFFYYFKTKENFVRIVFNETVDELSKGIVPRLQKIKNPLDKLKAVILNIADIVENKKHLMFLFFKVAASKEKYINDLMTEHEKKNFAFFSGLIKQCQEAKIINKNIDIGYLFPVIYGALMHAVFVKDAFENGAYSGKEHKKYLIKLTDFIIKLLK
jgi:AcrR family transcriptional regulator